MRIVRFRRGEDEPSFGWIMNDKVGVIEGSPFEDFQRREVAWDLDSVQLLAPVEPSKIICVGRNYPEHAKEVGAEVPEIPMLFLKPPTAVIGPGQSILLPPQSQKVDHEGELAVVVGRKGRWIQPETALNYVFGYTIGNDVTARDLQRRDGQWTRGKGFDTFCPLGPWIDTEFDPADTLISVRVNQELRQMASTKEMIFSIRQLISFISSVMTIIPGDVILTGTPAGVGPLSSGDTVRVAIDGLGELVNSVKIDNQT